MKPIALCILTLTLLCVPFRGASDHYDDLRAVLESAIHDQANAESEDQRLYELFDALWTWQMNEFPEYATYVGYPGQNHRWMDNSFAAEKRRDAIEHDILQALQAIDAEKLSANAKLDWKLIIRSSQRSIESQRFPSSLMPIDQMGGIQQGISRAIGQMPTSKASDYEDILSRLASAHRVVENDLERLRKGLAQGLTPPAVTLREVPTQFDALLHEDVTQTPFWDPFDSLPDSMPESEQNAILSRASEILRASLQPALAKMQSYLRDKYIPNARPSIGMSALPDGDAWYAFRVEGSTTTELSPEEIHALGLAEVERLVGKMKTLMSEIAFEGDFADFQAFMQQDDRFYYDDADELIAGYRDICKRADPELVRLFGTLPRLPYGVRETPAHYAASAPTAHYSGGSLEAGRPGYFYANTYDLRTRPIWGMEALSLHEAVPGHHLQISIAKELGEQHPLRRNLRYTAYIEGWGLYAETLGYEMGFYEDPYSRAGQISYELWRAIRLVIDTGMHALGWSRQQAIDYFKENSIMLKHDIVVEVDRYIVWPAQALAYKLGQLTIQELREEASQELGEQFDVRGFHDTILGSGALPLTVLREHVSSWIEKTQRD